MGMTDAVKPVLMGVDYGANGDWSAEVDFRKNPDGTLTIIDVRSFKTTIDGVVEPPTPSRSPEQPD